MPYNASGCRWNPFHNRLFAWPTFPSLNRNLQCRNRNWNRNGNWSRKGKSSRMRKQNEWPLGGGGDGSFAFRISYFLFLINREQGSPRKLQSEERNRMAAILRALLIGWRYRPMQQTGRMAKGKRQKDNNPLCTKFEHEIRTHSPRDTHTPIMPCWNAKIGDGGQDFLRSFKPPLPPDSSSCLTRSRAGQN